jgi:[acyl-carrier-protein] S-malonyltransferase
MSKTVFLFPGQGAQSVGMAKDLCATLPAAKALFDQAREILGYDLLEICVNGPAEKLNSTVVSQPAIYVASLAALALLRSQSPDIEKDVVAAAGLSLGEYTALVYAGVLSFVDGLRLVQKRGQAMQDAADATPSAMVAVLGMTPEQVQEVCAKARPTGTIEIANLLCPSNIVVSGTLAACEQVERIAPEMGAMKTVRLAVAGAFHTTIMKPADEKLAKAIAECQLQPARIPVWSNVDAQPHTRPEEVRDLLIRQVLEPVLWEKTMRGLMAAEIKTFVEIGPGRVLAGLMKRVDRKADMRNVGA